MQRSRRKIAAATPVCVAAVLALPAYAQRLNQAGQWCDHEKGDLQIKGCTIIIGSRRIAPAYRATAYNNRGNGWVDKADYDRALADYNEAIKILPSDAHAYYNRGNLWLKKQDHDHALADYDKAISLNPNHSWLYYNRGLTYSAKGDFNRAIVNFNEAIRLVPTDADAWSNRGDARFKKRDYDRAIADYSEAIRIDPGHAASYSGRARNYVRKQDYQHAAADYDESIVLDPKNSNRWNGRCFGRAIIGQLQEALADCNEALRLSPNDAHTLDSRGLVYLKLARFEEAIGQYDKALALDPNLADSLYGRGVAKIKTGNSKEGEADIAAATAIQNDVAEPFTRYGVPAITSEVAAPNSAVATAVAPVPATPSIVSPERRVALVIGNSVYSKAPALPNPRRDAEAVASALRRVGFQTVILETNLTRERFGNVLRSFASQAEQSDWALVYFAGHGIEMDGINYLIPVDACRNNPFLNQMRRTVASRSIGQGLGRVEPEAGTLVVYAAKHGELALDGDERNSPFVTALTSRIVTPGLEVRRLFDVVRDDVIAATNRKQQPFSYGSVSGSEDFYFVAR